MFGLPLEASLLLFGPPVFWILYTAVFLRATRDWQDSDAPDEDGE